MEMTNTILIVDPKKIEETANPSTFTALTPIQVKWDALDLSGNVMALLVSLSDDTVLFTANLILLLFKSVF